MADEIFPADSISDYECSSQEFLRIISALN